MSNLILDPSLTPIGAELQFRVQHRAERVKNEIHGNCWNMKHPTLAPCLCVIKQPPPAQDKILLN